MKSGWMMLAVIAGLLILSAAMADNNVQPVETRDSAEPSAVTAEANQADIAESPMAILLSPGIQGSGVQPMQASRMQPPGWKPDPPLDLSGPMPSDAEVRAAIVKAVNFILEQQQENGAWDVELTGTLLSDTADQAVDAIAATSLAGYALRRHVKADPIRIEAALRRAAEFVFDRVYRGKLPKNVWYANWRYTLGLKFLHQEYMNSSDQEFREEIEAVARRLVNGLLTLQLSNNDAPQLERKRRTRISYRFRDSAMPSQLGVVLAPPTDEEYRGGARVTKILEGTKAAEIGIAVGDRIIELEGLRVENSLDYYMQEAGFMGGQKIQLRWRRADGTSNKRDVTLDQTWPGYLGIKLNPGYGEGPVVEGFLPFSPARDNLEVGDVIFEVDRDEVKNLADFHKIERNVKPGDRVRIKVLRGEKKRKRSQTVVAEGAPEGWFGFSIEEEDKGDDNGVVVAREPHPSSPAGQAGLKLDDRVTWIGDTPILGLDHLLDFAGTVPAGRPYLVKWIRDGTEMEADMAAHPTPQPFDLECELDLNNQFQVYIRDVTRGSAADKAGMKRNDVFAKINGVPTGDFFTWRREFWKLSAGEEVTFTMRRGNSEVDVTFELKKAEITEEVDEEGGWAYYPEMGESPSFSTAAAILVLVDVSNDLDIKGMRRTLRGPLKAAGKLVNSLRIVDKQNGGQEAYVYRGGSLEGDQSHIDIKGAQGRNTICDLALVRLGGFGRRSSHLRGMISQWTKYRGELDAVKRMEYYATDRGGSPHNFDRNWNAAYYWMYGHYHTLLAAQEVGGRTYKDVNEICTKAVMLVREDDGTWLGHPSFGKLCGTSLALWILGETEGPWRDGYTDPTTQDKKDGEAADTSK